MLGRVAGFLVGAGLVGNFSTKKFSLEILLFQCVSIVLRVVGAWVGAIQYLRKQNFGLF